MPGSPARGRGRSAVAAGSTFWLPRRPGGWSRRRHRASPGSHGLSERQPGQPMPSALQGCHRRPQPRGPAGGPPAHPCPLSPPCSPQTAGQGPGHPRTPYASWVCDPTERPGLPRRWGSCRPLWGCPIPGAEGTAGSRAAAPSPPRLLSRCHSNGVPILGFAQNPPYPKQELLPF